MLETSSPVRAAAEDPSREASLDALLRAQVLARPQAIAVQAGDDLLSYAALDRRASRLSHLLRAAGVGEETPVAVVMGQTIEHIVAQVAICRAGGTYVPLDPEYPRERLELMLQDSGAALVLTDAASDARAPEGARRLCLDREAARVADNPDVFPAAPGGLDRRTHILYTSGSTGRPKGIEIVARAIRRLVLDTNYVQLRPADRVAQLASFAFDAAIFEVWGALLSGARIVLLPRSTVLDPPLFRAALARHGVTVMFLTTALFNLTAQACPDAFRRLRYLLVGGERADPRTMRAVLLDAPPENFLHVYGPTEGTTFSTSHRLSLGEVSGSSVAIGGPIRGTQAFILGPDRAPVTRGQPGELYIGGEGLARGYLGRPDLTAERFVEVEGLAERGPLRLYRTGDLARWRADGVIEFLGRTDFQVKIRGFRIELEEVEAAIVSTGLVTGAVTAAEEREEGERQLVAYVVPREPDDFDADALMRRLRAKLPAYMLPARVLAIAALPLNAHGKVDRAALIAAFAARVRAIAPPQLRGDVAATVAAIWRDLLACPALVPADDFFARGGDSLLATRLVLRVREALAVQVPVYALYTASTLQGFTAVVEAARRGRLRADYGQDDASAWRRDAWLPAEVAADIERAARSSARAPGLVDDATVLLTGATGFLGGFLLRDLMTRTRARVLCLVRAEDEAEGAARIEASMRKYGLWRDDMRPRLRPLVGDLRAPWLGLSPVFHAALAEEVDVVIHSAAHVNYVQPYASHREANVLGTTEVLRFAARGRMKPVHHVSSIAVFGPSGRFEGKTRVDEDSDLDEYAECLRYDMGYSQSKWAAEQLVWDAARRGLPVSVYRPGFIMGDSRSGAGNPDDFMGRLIRGCVELGACPDLPHQRKEFVPVDYVSATLLEIAARPEAQGGAYHLVPPRPELSVDMNHFFTLLRELGYPLVRLPYAQWVERLLADPRVEESALYPLIPMLCERVFRGEATRWELHEDMPAYDAGAAVRASAGRPAPYRAMDAALLARYVDTWAELGLLPRRPAQSSQAARIGISASSAGR